MSQIRRAEGRSNPAHNPHRRTDPLDAIAPLAAVGAGAALAFSGEAEAEETIGLPELADPDLDGAQAQGERQTLDLGDGRLEHRQIWRLSDGSYALRVTIQDEATQNQEPHRWYRWAADEPLSTGGSGEAPSRRLGGDGRSEDNGGAGFAGVPVGILAGASISRRRPVLGAVTGSGVGLATASALGANDEQALWSTVLPAALGPMARHVGDYGVDTVRASLPSGRARIGQFAETLPNEAPTTRGQQVLSDDYLGPRQMVDMDSGAFDVPALDAAAPRRVRVAGDEIAEQGYSQPLEVLPSMRERYDAMRPAERLRMAEQADATEQVRAASLGEARQASTSARLDRAAGEWGEREALPAPTAEAQAASSEQAWWFDPVTGEPLYGARTGRRPPPQTPRRPMADLGQSAQQRRLGEAEGATGAQAARSVAERELGQSFKTGAAAMRALRERMMSDPAFAEKMNRLYPALVAAVLGGGVAGEMHQRRLN